MIFPFVIWHLELTQHRKLPDSGLKVYLIIINQNFTYPKSNNKIDYFENLSIDLAVK